MDMGEGEKQMWEAIRLFPYDPIPPFLMAEEYRKKGACDRAVPLYKWSLATTDTAGGFVIGPYTRCLLQLGKVDEAHDAALRGVGRGDQPRQYRSLLHRVDSVRAVVRSGGPVGPMPPAYPQQVKRAQNAATESRNASRITVPAGAGRSR
jgi:hypothetical protein